MMTNGSLRDCNRLCFHLAWLSLSLNVTWMLDLAPAFSASVRLIRETLLSVRILTKPSIGSPEASMKALSPLLMKHSALKSQAVHHGHSVRRFIMSIIWCTAFCKSFRSISNSVLPICSASQQTDHNLHRLLH